MEELKMAGESKGSLMTVREDVRVLDATLRDGGLVNNFYFTDDFVRALYDMNVAAGVDYMEFGYKASKDLFDPEKFGKWKFSDDEDIRAIVGENKTGMKISVMADVGRTDFRRDILPRSESPIDLVRIATYINTLPAAIEMIEDAKKKGYETSVNVMAVSKVGTEDLAKGIELLAQSSVDTLYLVDSFGAFYPEQIVRLTEMYLSIAEKYGKHVGIHAHNNQQLAFANTIESLRLGASYVDGTVCGMGRGAGNCYLESLLSFLKNPKYNLVPLMRFIEKYMVPLKQQETWGFDLPYLLTGILNSHPAAAIEFIRDGRCDYTQFYQEILDDIG